MTARSGGKDKLTRLVEETVEILQRDVERYLDNNEKSDDVFWRRGFVRAVFAYIEGLISTLKLKALLTDLALQHKLASQRIKLTEGGGFKTMIPDIVRHFETAQQGAGFSSAETLLLKDATFRLDDDGRVKFEKAKLSLASNLQFAFLMYAKAGGVEYSIPKGDAGWDKLKRSIKVRDRITHPKRSRDLDVSYDELEMVMSAYVWVFACQVELLKCFKDKYESDEAPETSMDDAAISP